MNAYFDISNLRSLAKSGGHQDFKSCTDMLRQNYNLCFNFSKDLLAKEKKTGTTKYNESFEIINTK